MPVSYKLTGVDGAVWDLSSRTGPIRLVSDPDGIGGSPFKNLRAQNLQEDGSKWIDRNDEALALTFDVHLKGARLTGDAAVAMFVAWRKTLGRGAGEMLLEVTSTGGGIRRCKPRLEETLPKVDLDYIYNGGYFREQVKTMPDESWFRSDEYHGTYTSGTFASASVDNTGDIEAPPRYVLTGPLTDPSIGILGENVTLTGVTVPSGEVWTIETDPAGRYVKDAAGVNKAPAIYTALGQPFSWHKLAPPYVTTPVHFTASGTTGASKFEVFLPQLHIAGVG